LIILAKNNQMFYTGKS